MRKLVLLTSLIAIALCFSSCKKDKTEEPAKCEDANAVCPIHDAKQIFDAKNSIASLIKEAIADNDITDEEAEKINNAFCEYQTVDAEIKTKYLDKKEAQDELFAILNAENNYNKSLKLAIDAKGYEKISSKVK